MTNEYKSKRVRFGKPAQQKTFQTSRTENPLFPEMGLKGLSRPSWPLTLALTTAMFFMGTMYIEENGTLSRNVEENSQIMNMEQKCHCEIHHPVVTNKPCPTTPPAGPKAEPTEIKLDESTEMQENTKDAEEKAALKKEEKDLRVTEINLTGKGIPNI